jgi:hypothetical protein
MSEERSAPASPELDAFRHLSFHRPEPFLPPDLKRGETLKAKYLSARVRHPEIHLLSSGELDGFASRLTLGWVDFCSAYEVFFRSILLFLFIAEAVSLDWFIPWLRTNENHIENGIWGLRPFHSSLAFAFVLAALTAVAFLSLAPALKRTGSSEFVRRLRSTAQSWSAGLNVQHPSVLWFSWLEVSALISLGLFALAGRVAVLRPFIVYPISLCICLAAFFIVVVIAFALIFRIVFDIHQTLLRPLQSARREMIAEQLLDLLATLDEVADLGCLTIKGKKRLRGAILELSGGVQRLFDYIPLPSRSWARAQARLASLNVLRLVILIDLPQQKGAQKLKTEILRYLNIILSGHFDDLPRGEDGAEEGRALDECDPSGWHRVGLYLGLAAYLVLPVLAFAILVLRLRLEPWLTGPIQASAGLLYVMWVVAGLLFYSKHFSSEYRDLITEGIRTVFGRR